MSMRTARRLSDAETTATWVPMRAAKACASGAGIVRPWAIRAARPGSTRRYPNAIANVVTWSADKSRPSGGEQVHPSRLDLASFGSVGEAVSPRAGNMDLVGSQ